MAAGRDFDSSGTLSARGAAADDPASGPIVLDEAGATDLAHRLRSADFAVRSVEEKPFRSSPKPPFMTSTLQQEGGRKLRMSASQVMRVAQDLYAERLHHLHADRLASTLSETALTAARDQIRDLYGAEYLPDAPAPTTARSRTPKRPTRPSAPPGRRSARRTRCGASSEATSTASTT